MIRYTSRDLLSILLIVSFLFSTGIVGCSLCSLLEGFPEVWEEGQPEEREGPPLEEPSCVQWCLSDALTYEEREEEVDEETELEEMEIGLESLVDKFGLEKVVDAVVRMSRKE